MSKKKYIDLDTAVDIGYLGDWYQSSIDTTVPPVWTDEHLEELCKDFIVIPKDTAPIIIKEPKQGKWISSVNKNNFYVEICSECGYIEEWNLETDRNFCPNCGAEMDKEQER